MPPEKYGVEWPCAVTTLPWPTVSRNQLCGPAQACTLDDADVVLIPPVENDEAIEARIDRFNGSAPESNALCAGRPADRAAFVGMMMVSAEV